MLSLRYAFLLHFLKKAFFTFLFASLLLMEGVVEKLAEYLAKGVLGHRLIGIFIF